jgi:hypothetical protein
MTAVGEHYFAQADGGLPTTLVAGSATGESGVYVQSLRFRGGAHFSATPQKHLIWLSLSRVRFDCRITKLDHGVDNMAMAMSRSHPPAGWLSCPPMPRTCCRRLSSAVPLEGEAPTIEVAVGYSKSNTSPILELFLSRLDELVGPNQKH